ncbi:MAG TPA: hypothetical protein VG841_13805 [Caulobacterales bacterium]|nr:hypothetical protein [Caulobacterales bacterium]
MIGEALAYPLLLLLRRPVTVLGALIAGFAVSLLIDEAWRELAKVAPDLSRPARAELSWSAPWLLARAAYYVVHAAGQSFPVALIFVGALIDLGVRERRPIFSLGDGLRISALTAIFVVLLVAPLQVAQPILAQSVVVRGSYALASVLIGAGIYALQALVFVPFFLSWPHTVAVRKIRLYPIWRAPRPKASAAIGALLLTLLAAGILTVVGAALSGIVFMTLVRDDHGLPIYYSILRIWPSLIAAYVIDAASALIYARVTPPKAERVAEHF